MRVLIANEPQAYREALMGALRELRPGAEFVEAEPEWLERKVRRLRPRVVLCSHLPEPLPPGPRGWVELYPEGESYSTLVLDGEQVTVPAMQLDDLLSIVDRAGLPATAADQS